MPKYIGVTGQTLKNRLKSHKCPQFFSPREVWIREVLNRGELGICLIEEVANEQAIEREIFWTCHYADSGIVNKRLGNKGTPELNKQMSESAKKKTINWKQLESLHTGNIGRVKSLETRQKASKTQKGIKKSETVVQNMKKAITEKYGFSVTYKGVRYQSLKEATRETGISYFLLRKLGTLHN